MSRISFCEHYSGRYGRYVRERRLTASGSMGMFELLQPAGDFSDPAVDDLVIIETKSSMSGDWNLGAGQIRNAESGLIFVVPPDCPTNIVIDQTHMFRAFTVPQARLSLRTGQSYGAKLPDLSKLQQHGTRNPFILSLLKRLWAAGTESGCQSRLLADCAVLALLAEIGREAGEPAKPMRGGLSPRQLMQVENFVEAHLGHDFGLMDLAKEADLSPFHFARAFKQTTGLTPFQYLSKRRIARAQKLLETTDMALVTMALVCGFASQSSFTAAFGREAGVSPAKWRRYAANVVA